MEPNPEVNAKGFWEDMDIYRLDDEMLHALGTDWDQATPLTAAQIAFLRAEGFVQRGKELLQEKALQAPVFGFKDPRLCRLLAFWQEVLAERGEGVAYLLALRNPASIADSLQKRDGMDRTQSYLMWLSHTLNVLALSTGQRRVLVEFDHLLQEPLPQLQRVAQAFNLPLDAAAAQDYAQEFLDKGLRHNRHSMVDLASDPACPALVLTVYRLLRKVAADRYDWDSPAFQRRLLGWQRQLEVWCPLMMCIDRLHTGERQP